MSLLLLEFLLVLLPNFRTRMVVHRDIQYSVLRSHKIDLGFTAKTSKLTDCICEPAFQLFSRKNFKLPTFENPVF